MKSVAPGGAAAHDQAPPLMLLGCDFTSAPSRRKPIVLATGQLAGRRLLLEQLLAFSDFAGFSAWLAQDRAWLGGFDLPFGLPRTLVEDLGWPSDWSELMAFYAGMSRAQIREVFAAYCQARPAGAKFAHRATDRLSLSSPSMKWVNPPVAYMMHAGVPLLLAAGVALVGLSKDWQRPGAHRRLALEAYPGLLAREFLGQRSYKSDNKAQQNAQRLIARKDLIHALEQGQGRLGLQLKLSHAQRERLTDDASGDSLDAVLCLLQAAWAQGQHAAGDPLYGLPQTMDPLEGWIITA